MPYTVYSDLARRRRIDLKNSDCESGRVERVETMVFEIILRLEKWLVCSLYKQPCTHNLDLVKILEGLVNNCFQ